MPHVRSSKGGDPYFAEEEIDYVESFESTLLFWISSATSFQLIIISDEPGSFSDNDNWIIGSYLQM
jgi:hypothetical protein